MSKVCGIDIKRLWYAEPESITADVTAASLKALLASNSVTEVLNVHQDTWNVEEAEPSQDSYKNQLTGGVYRMGAKNMGDITVSWTIGQYDFATKADLLGGDTIGTGEAVGWKRARGIVEKKKAIIALTEDGVYMVFPYCNVAAREQNQDGAIGVGVSATVLEPTTDTIRSEYWFLQDAVDTAEAAEDGEEGDGN